MGVYPNVKFITSDGFLSDEEMIVITVIANNNCSQPTDPAFNYAIVTGKDITWSGSGSCNASGISTQANGQFVMSGSNMFTANVFSCVKISMSGSSTISGDAMAPSIILTGSGKITGAKTIGSVPQVAIPDIDLTPYYNWALSKGKVVNGNLNLSSSRDTIIPGGVLWVNGNINISGSMSVTGCIIATGNVTISGSGTLNRADKMPVIISTNGSVTLSGSGTITGLIFAQTGDIVKNGSGDLVGMLICKGNLTKTGSWSFTYQKYLPYPPGCNGE